MILKKCDICGNNEETIILDENDKRKNITFTNSPLKLKIPNYKKEFYNIFIQLYLEKESDTKKIEEFQKEMSNPENIMEMIFSGGGSGNDNPNEAMISSDKLPKLENPSPNICDNCKRNLIKFLLQYGNFNYFEKF